MRLFASSALIALVLMTAAAAVGLAVEGVYRDNALVEAAWRGNDLVTLFLAVPLLAGAIARARQGSRRALLISLGVLAYAVYNYAFYLFGAAFNHLFLLYVGVLASSTLGLIDGLTSRDIRPEEGRIVAERPDRLTGWLIIAVCLFLGLFWITTSVQFIFTGEVPAMVTATGHPTNVTGALDLWMVVTFGVLSGTWLLREEAWGFVFSAVWTVKGAVYMTALSAATISGFLTGTTDSLVQLAVWIPIGVVCVAGAAILLRASGPLGGSGVKPWVSNAR